MDQKGCLVEVLGVPDVLPDDVTIDKLLIYFLRKKNGGGEVLKVLYPCYQPGQAFVTFEQPEVAAEVVRRSSHMLELNDQRYHLTVRAADHAQMDFPVKATLQLNALLDKIKVHDFLRSQGFVTKDLTRDQVRVKGSFLKLKSVKASLETLLKAPATVGAIPSPSTVPKVSSGDISRHHTDVAAAKRGPLDSKHERASPSAPTISSSLLRGSSLVDSPGTGNQPGSVRTGEVYFAVAHELYDYANCLRKKDVDTILVSHDVKLRVKPVDDAFVLIILSGNGANAGMNKLKTLLANLFKSLVTTEVPLKDLTPEGMRLVAKNVDKSVLMRKRNGRLHLIGPSRECYVLKQKLLGRTADLSQQRGRITERKPTRRSLSLPPTSRKTDGAGAEGYAPSKYQDDAGRSRGRALLP
ncbi:uncharacterized protein si:dkey-154b15.1 [Takifugu flavidus]|uniref:RRM domain-containing protein n=1 Tax=Takifugu flavidus TaxID=433684 RepID=A0A5C6NF60_9TELE|nr:uncharacterized protein si:dkey-154b15.1 [Takifugu flavidus]TWW65813.1 hypothetical protein D4764_21G0007130 [Takifugu flavidus]